VTQITIKNIYNACHKLKQSIRNLRIEIQNLMKCLVEDKYIYIYSHKDKRNESIYRIFSCV
jgi:hypothetical protein